MILFETEFNPEVPTKDDVSRLFKQQGPSIEAETAFGAWYEHMQKEMDKSQKPYSRLEFNIEVADLMADCNLIAEAREYVWDALYELEAEDQKEHSDELHEELVRLHRRILEVEAKLG